MLKHIKDIRSPIAVAQQKHAARKASASGDSTQQNGAASHLSTNTTMSGSTVVGTPSVKSMSVASEPGRTASRPPRLHVTHDGIAQGAPGPMTGTAMQPGWPELMSPAVDNRERVEPSTSADAVGDAGAKAAGIASGGIANGQDGEQPGSAPSMGGSTREMPPASAQGISYAVAIYPYMAEQEDEFDVVVYVHTRLPFVHSSDTCSIAAATPSSFSPAHADGGSSSVTRRVPATWRRTRPSRAGYLQAAFSRQGCPWRQQSRRRARGAHLFLAPSRPRRPHRHPRRKAGLLRRRRPQFCHSASCQRHSLVLRSWTTKARARRSWTS